MSDIAERSLHTRIARSVEAIRRSFVDNLLYVTVRTFDNATTIDHYTALAYTIRDRLLARVVATDVNY
jgi:starch phosphorylase